MGLQPGPRGGAAFEDEGLVDDGIGHGSPSAVGHH